MVCPPNGTALLEWLTQSRLIFRLWLRVRCARASEGSTLRSNEGASLPSGQPLGCFFGLGTVFNAHRLNIYLKLHIGGSHNEKVFIYFKHQNNVGSGPLLAAIMTKTAAL